MIAVSLSGIAVTSQHFRRIGKCKKCCNIFDISGANSWNVLIQFTSDIYAHTSTFSQRITSFWTSVLCIHMSSTTLRLKAAHMPLVQQRQPYLPDKHNRCCWISASRLSLKRSYRVHCISLVRPGNILLQILFSCSFRFFSVVSFVEIVLWSS